MSEFIRRLNKRQHSIGGNKYFIDCKVWLQEPASINLEKIVRNNHDITVLKAFIGYRQYTKKNKHVVLKIGPVSKTVLKEYEISKKLQSIPGFVKDICVFDCHDNTNITSNLASAICKATEIDDNHKDVLVMPYVHGSSIANYKWNTSNVQMLKSLLKQAVMSSMEAYHEFGFIHNDFHLDNILMKRTKQHVVKYKNDVEIATHGFKIVIIDFDRSFINVDKERCLEYYWKNLENMLARLNFDLQNVRVNADKANLFVRNAGSKMIPYKDTIHLLSVIDDINIEQFENQNVVYNPDVL